MNSICGSSRAVFQNRHNCLVVFRRRWRDLWRKSFWVVCIYCDRMHGPHPAAAIAQQVADTFNQRVDA